MKYEINAGETSVTVDFQVQDDQLFIRTEQGRWQLDAAEIQPGVYSVLLNQRSFVVGVCEQNGIKTNVNGTPAPLSLLDAVHLHLRELGWQTVQEEKAGLITAQIPGLITRIFHAVGDEVTAGEPLFLMEAMKMENEIKAPVAGVISSIAVSEGQPITKGDLLVDITPVFQE